MRIILILTFFSNCETKFAFSKIFAFRFLQHIVLYNNHPVPYRFIVAIFQFKNFPLAQKFTCPEERNFTSFLCIHSRGHKFAYRIFEILSGERKVLVKLAFLKRTPFQTDEDINRGSL